MSSVSLLILLSAQIAGASMINVTDTADIIANDGKCTLREAVKAAGTDTASGTADGECPAGDANNNDTIFLPAAETPYYLTISLPEGVADTWEDFDTGDLDLAGKVAIIGAGKDTTIIDAKGLSNIFGIREFELSSGVESNILIKSVTLRNGGSGAIAIGGGTVEVEECLFEKNRTPFSGGAISHGGGKLVITGSTFSENIADGNLSNGSAINSYRGEIEVKNSTFINNTSTNYGYTIYVSKTMQSPFMKLTIVNSQIKGGAGDNVILRAENSTVNIANTVIQGNTETKKGYGIQAIGTTLVMKGSAIIATGEGLYSASTKTSIDDCVFAENEIGIASVAWGNQESFTITNSTLTNNERALFLQSAFPVVVRQSTIAGNKWGVDAIAGTSVSLQNTLLLNNVADCFKGVSSKGNNIVQSTPFGDTCTPYQPDATDNVTATADMALGTLVTIGPTWLRHFPLVKSPTNPALNKGNADVCPAQDQLGKDRIGPCDIGAIEAEPFCGDGVVNGTDQCDDANTNNDDGCSNQCLTSVNYTVSATADAADAACNNEGICGSLRAALKAANAYPNHDSITLGAGNYILTLPGANDDAANSGDLDITNPVTIQGSGAAATTVSMAASVADRVFHIVGSHTAVLRDLTISGGNGVTEGGAILNDGGTLNIESAIVGPNKATKGAGLFNKNKGIVIIERCSFINNAAVQSGGGIQNESGGSLTIHNSTVAGNKAETIGASGGGGLRNLGWVKEGDPNTSVAITNTTFYNNAAPGQTGGAISNWRGELSVRHSTFVKNSAVTGGGIASAEASPTLEHVVLVGNVLEDCSGTFVTKGMNILGNKHDGCQPSDINAVQYASFWNQIFLPYIAAPTVPGGGHYPAKPNGFAANVAASDPLRKDQLGNPCLGPACDLGAVESTCGDGAVQAAAGEECDDGNIVDNDSCLNSCITAKCGDGKLQIGEECDDGTKNSNTAANACRTDCKQAHCGDGVKDNDELCDDGNVVADDECPTTCKSPSCGNGIKEKLEECDSGTNNSDSGACTILCKIAACGDGLVQKDVEACDDGNKEKDDGCNDTCKSEVCGDNIVQLNEACDDGNTASGDGCSGDCKRKEICGDGIVDTGEKCDGGTDCDSTCNKKTTTGTDAATSGSTGGGGGTGAGGGEIVAPTPAAPAPSTGCSLIM